MRISDWSSDVCSSDLLVRDYDPSLPDLAGDADRLVQATWNLVRNAIEAGAATVTLRTRAEHAVRIGDEVHALALRLDVVDDGHGVPAALEIGRAQSELQSLMRLSYAVFCLQQTKHTNQCRLPHYKPTNT